MNDRLHNAPVLIMVCDRNLDPATGEGRLILNRAEGLFERCGIRTKIFALARAQSRKADFGATNEVPGYSISRFDYEGLKSFAAAFWQLIRSVKAFVATGENVRGIIFSGVLLYFTLPFLPRAGKRIADIHGALEEWLEYPPVHVFGSRFVTRLAYTFFSTLEHLAVKRMDAALVVTQELGEHIQAKYGCKNWFVIPCGVAEPAVDSPTEARARWRAKFGFTEADTVVTYSGGLSPWQMIPETIDFFLHYRAGHTEAKLLLLVTQPEKARKLYRRHGGDMGAAVFDKLSATEALEAMLAADIGIVLREANVTNRVAFPNKFAEYIAGGVVVVTSPGLSGPARMVTDNRLGIVQGVRTPDLAPKNARLLAELLEERQTDWLAYYSKTLEFCRLNLQMTNALDPLGAWLNRRPVLALAVTSHVSTDFFTGQFDYLMQAGFDVAVICTPGWNPPPGVAYYPVDMEREISPLKDLRSLWRLIRLLSRIRPDIINAGTPKAGLLVSVAAFVCRIGARVYTCHGLRLETLTGFKKTLLTATERITAFCVQRVVCVSPSLRQKVVELGLTSADKAVVVGAGSCNGIDLQRFSLLSGPAGADGDRKLCIGFVGRLTRDKGIYELVRAFELLKPEFPGLVLMLVGGYEDGDPVDIALQQQIDADQQILNIGEVPDPVPYYRRMNVLALPTYREGLPTVLLEAGAMGIPVVASRATGCVDVVVDRETGFLTRPGDSAELAERLGDLLRDPKLAATMGQKAHEHIAGRFRQETVWANLVGFYFRMLGDARR